VHTPPHSVPPDTKRSLTADLQDIAACAEQGFEFLDLMGAFPLTEHNKFFFSQVHAIPSTLNEMTMTRFGQNTAEKDNGCLFLP